MVRVVKCQGYKITDVEGENAAALGCCSQQLLNICGIQSHPRGGSPRDIMTAFT